MSSYSSSTQKKYWTFKDAEELLKYRRNANYKYIHSNENSNKVGFHDTNLCSFAIRANGLSYGKLPYFLGRPSLYVAFSENVVLFLRGRT